MNKNVKAFIKHVKAECKKHNVRLLLSKRKLVTLTSDEGSTTCNGHFNQKTRTLAVATGQSFNRWFQILAHEYGHMTQFVENSRFFSDKHLQACDDTFDWVEGKKSLSYAESRKAVMLNMSTELDCERRTVELIKRFNLPINIDEYTQKSNSYVLFYHLVAKHRRFYKGGSEPYNVKKVWTKMPKHFNMNYRKPDQSLLDVLSTLPLERK